MRYSIWPSNAHPINELLDTARWADSIGAYSFWYADHYMPNTGTTEVSSGDAYECWGVLPAVATATTGVRVGSLVSPTTVHHPAVLANRAATLDHLSHGRMVLGVGAGWQINEHHAYGIELPPPGPRVSRFDEAIQIMRALLDPDQDEFSFDGEYYQLRGAVCFPKPVQRPLPILVGTGSPRMLRITAHHADEWNTWGHPTEAAVRRSRFIAGCEAVGRDPASMHTSVQALFYLTDTEQEAAAIADKHANGPMSDRVVAGTADQLLAVCKQYYEMGFNELIVPDFHLTGDAASRHESLVRLHTEVLSRMN